MKSYFKMVIIFSFFLLAIPTFIFIKDNPEILDKKKPVIIDDVKDDKVKMLITSSDEIIELDKKDYIIGSVFAQMPAEFNIETIKCQVVIANTYIYRQHLKEQSIPTTELKGADISDNAFKYQPYFSLEKRKELYGNKFEEYNAKIESAYEECKDLIITYNNDVIIPAFHSISPGMTEDAKNVWGTEIPYLKSVPSLDDLNCKNYSDVQTLTKDEIYARLTQGIDNLTLSENPQEWISNLNTTQSGCVISLKVGNTTLKGSEIQKILNIRSPFYTIEYSDNSFIITAKGFGHGVGLSQYGAETLSKTKSYKEILMHYYTDCKIVEISPAERPTTELTENNIP